MTVTNAFSRPDQLSASLREKILAAATELGYAGPTGGRTLAAGRPAPWASSSTARTATRLSDGLAALFLAVVAEELGRGGLALTLPPNLGTPDVEPVRDVAMDGAIVDSCSPVDEHVDWVRRRHLPLASSTRGRRRFPSVIVADRAGARAAATISSSSGTGGSALLDGGISTPWTNCTTARALGGWRDALGPAGITPVLWHVERPEGEEADAAAGELLAAPDRPTAVLAFSDALGADVLRAAADLACGRPWTCRRRLRRLALHAADPVPTTVRQDGRREGAAWGRRSGWQRSARGAWATRTSPGPHAGDRAGAAGHEAPRPTPSAERMVRSSDRPRSAPFVGSAPDAPPYEAPTPRGCRAMATCRPARKT